MPNFQSLPPELVLEIFSLASRLPRLFPTFVNMRERNETLLSLALVHSTWTKMAQELFGQELMIFGKRGNHARRLDLIKENSDRIRLKGLTLIHVHLESWLIDTSGTWEGLTRFQEITQSSRRLRDYAQFAHLSALSIRFGSLNLATDQDSPAFPHLRRLVFCAEIEGARVSSSGSLLSPKHMPNLLHLGTDANTAAQTGIFDRILPQLESLAITGRCFYRVGTSFEIFRNAHLLRSLRHLSATFDYLQPATKFFDQFATLELDLESLHINEGLLHVEGAEAFFVAVVGGKQERLRSKRVVVYGSTPVRASPGLNPDAFEWREDWHGAPFEEFDGE